MKKIEEYLHLYLGCECMTPKGIGKLFRYDIETNWTWCVFGIMGPDVEHSGYAGDIKPILRPLSDMTEEEKKQVKEIEIGYVDVYDCAEITKYLLSIHIDIFNLIPAGLAIDKTTLK